MLFNETYTATDEKEGISFFLYREDAIDAINRAHHGRINDKVAVIKVKVKGIRQTGIWKGELSGYTAPAGHADEVTFLEEIKSTY